MSPVAQETLRRFVDRLADAEDHVGIAAIAAALCALSEPPPWAAENVKRIRALSADGASFVAWRESNHSATADALENRAGWEDVGLRERTRQGPATAEDVAKGAEIADALRALAVEVRATAGR